MGRRNTYDPIALRAEASKQLRTLLAAFDLAEAQAQTYAVAMIDMIAGIALSTTLRPEDMAILEFRIKAAQIILNRAYGHPASKTSVTIHEPQQIAPGGTVMQDIETAQRAAAEFKVIEGYLQKPFEEWPDWMKERFDRAQSPFYTPPLDGPASANTGQ